MKKTITLYRGTSIKDVELLEKEIFTKLTWWTNNYETVEHYYEGAVLELRISIDTDDEDDYIGHESELCIPLRMYKYGMITVNYPPGAEWYSFSPSYINTNMKSYREITLESAKKKMPN